MDDTELPDFTACLEHPCPDCRSPTPDRHRRVDVPPARPQLARDRNGRVVGCELCIGHYWIEVDLRFWERPHRRDWPHPTIRVGEPMTVGILVGPLTVSRPSAWVQNQGRPT